MLHARAHSNIALIKYWGKRSEALKLPLNGSLSLTLDALYTETSVNLHKSLTQDQLFLNGELAPAAMQTRIQSFMAHLRTQLDFKSYAEIHSHNSFPTGAGLASSASAFAALTLATVAALELNLSPTALSRLARQGSGSACRSIFGGFAEWLPGNAADGADSYAVPLNETLEVWMAVLVLNQAHKATGSGDGMAHTVATSPLYAGWHQSVSEDLEAMKAALHAQDLNAVGELMEHNALKMHATSLAARPAVIYWQPETLALIQVVQRLRAEGHKCWFTIDAGPNLKVLMPAGSEATVAALQAHPAVQQLILCLPGPAAHLRASS